jgi:anti-sigma factor (TIGR02949 family)
MPDCSWIDPLVTPFVDGELPEGQQETLTAHITACPKCRTRVAAERAVRTLMRSRRAELDMRTAPPSLKSRCAALRQQASRPAPFESFPATSGRRTAARTWRSRFAPLALAATLLLAVAGAFVYLATRSSSRVLAAELAMDHEKCFRLNTLLGTQHSPDEVRTEMASLFDWSVRLPDMAGHQDITLVGSRPCLYGEGKVAHIMYRHNGQPVSLFMLPRETRRNEIVDVLGHRACIWSEGDRTFVLVARESESELEQMAAVVKTTIK